MTTTIRISKELKQKLTDMKISEKDTYEGVIWDLLEDKLELSEQSRKEIASAREGFEKGEYIIHSELKKRLGL